MFEKTLSDVVKGIRASKRDTGLYISQCIAEIKTELNSTDLYVKANALQKLTFLQMMGYGMSWASFATIEVMSSPRFAHKRIGYLAACQGFTQDTEVILLTTNLLKKELRGASSGNMQGVYEAGLATNCISNIVTEDLARDLLPELTNLTTHPQPYLRKKAVLCLFKLFVKYPQGLRLTFDRIEQCLTDTSPSVCSCAVNVITELSDKNPKNYLPLAPAFFALLTKSSNNWMLIKVVKLLGSLVPEEPRLARKLLEPLAAMVESTKAKSLLFEAVHTLTLSLPYCRKSDGTMPAIVPDIVELCATTLRGFVEEEDQNLKYLGLVGFGSLTASHPKVLSSSDYRPLILACLSDEDVTIRTRALDLLRYMASRKNLVELVTQLWNHVTLASGQYKHDLVLKIIQMCSGDKYALLNDFGWYFSLLVRLGHVRGIEVHASLLKQQLMDVALRVLPVRTYAVRRSMQELLLGRSAGMTNEAHSGGTTVDVEDNGRGKHIMPELLPGLAWIVGEYSGLIPEALDENGGDGGESFDFVCDESSQGLYHSLVQTLLAPCNTRDLPTTTQSIYIQASMKVFAAATSRAKVSGRELQTCLDTFRTCLPVYMQSTSVEVQERAVTSMELLRSLELLGDELNGLPALVPENDDDSVEEGSLLEIDQSPNRKGKKSDRSMENGSGGSSSFASRSREAASLLNYLMKPEPMKPVSVKAQRKKRQNPVGVDVGILNAPIDLSVFALLIEEELAHRPADGIVSMESVSFTEQRPLRGVPLPVAPTPISTDATGFGGASDNNGGTSASSFQRSGMPDGIEETTSLAQPQQQRHQHDPFYLDSRAPAEGDNVLSGNRFGAIQLGGSDEESNEPKKRKKKKTKRQKGRPSKSSEAGEVNPFMDMIPSKSLRPESADVVVTVYSSDEGGQAPTAQEGRKKGPGSEFAGLAKVDLTTPLREDEVMPARTHHIVQQHMTKGSPRKHEKRKKKKESKKRKKTAGGEATGGGVGDLLDLGFMPIADVSSEAAAGLKSDNAVSSGGDNAISTAFDDLLGLSAPAPVQQEAPQSTMQPTLSKKDEHRAWMLASLKTANAGGPSVVDWTRVSLLFNVNWEKIGKSVAASLTLRLENHTQNALTNAKVQLKGHDDILIGGVEQGSRSASSAETGPISCKTPDATTDLKGFLVASGSTVPVKLSLPATSSLVPWSGLTQDDIMRELSSSTKWYSHSARIDISTAKNPSKAITVVRSFLRASEIEGDPGGDSLVATLASQSSSGSRVLALLKVRTSTCKVDIRCTGDRLGKALASDMKKLAVF